MTKQDWLDYFEAVNGRSATPEELAKALLDGEYTEEELVSQSAPAQPNSEDIPNYQSMNQNSVPQQDARVTPDQQVYNVQVAVPSSFSIFINQLWQWIVSAWKKPTSVMRSGNKYNALTALGLQAFFAALTIFYTIKGLGNIVSGIVTGLVPYDIMQHFYSYPNQNGLSLGFPIFFRIFVVIAFFIFTIIFSAFIVKRFVYKDSQFTFKQSIEWFGRLSAINILLLGSSFILSILGVYSLVFILLYLAICVLPLGSVYTLAQLPAQQKIDKFYLFLLGILINSIINMVFFSTGVSFIGQMFVSSLF